MGLTWRQANGGGSGHEMGFRLREQPALGRSRLVQPLLEAAPARSRPRGRVSGAILGHPRTSPFCRGALLLVCTPCPRPRQVPGPPGQPPGSGWGSPVSASWQRFAGWCALAPWAHLQAGALCSASPLGAIVANLCPRSHPCCLISCPRRSAVWHSVASLIKISSLPSPWARGCCSPLPLQTGLLQAGSPRTKAS